MKKIKIKNYYLLFFSKTFLKCFFTVYWVLLVFALGARIKIWHPLRMIWRYITSSIKLKLSKKYISFFHFIYNQTVRSKRWTIAHVWLVTTRSRNRCVTYPNLSWFHNRGWWEGKLSKTPPGVQGYTSSVLELVASRLRWPLYSVFAFKTPALFSLSGTYSWGFLANIPRLVGLAVDMHVGQEHIWSNYIY